MSFDEWWKAGTSTKVPLYGEANAKKAWDYQQARIDALEAENALLVDKPANAIIAELQAQLTALRESAGNLLNDNSPQNREDVYKLLEASDE